MHAASVLVGREAHLSEVAWLDSLGEVRAADRAPANEVFGRDEDPPVVTRAAARAAREAVELVRHRASVRLLAAARRADYVPPMSLRRRVAPLFALALAGACSTPAVEPADAGADATAPDANGHGIHWASGPALPEPLAYATAQIFAVDMTSYVYVIGGSSASRGSLGTVSSAVYRARIDGDTLGAWERIGVIAPGGVTQGLVGHGSLPIHDAMGNQGAAIAGGGDLTHGALPIVLAVYSDPLDGHLFDWSRFPPMLAEGQSFGVFVPFDPFDFALVGGIVNSAPSTRVVIASVRNGSTSPDWTSGPPIPEARAHPAYFVRALEVYLLGGENNDGPVSDVVRTVHDASDAVTGWETVGTIDGAPVAAAAFVYHDEAWLAGGIDGTTFDGPPSARVRRAPFDAMGHVGTFADDAESLPLPLAGSALATDFDHYFLIGGMTTPDLTATDAVVIGTIY